MANLFTKDAIIPDQLRILFLGDSITQDGRYIALMDDYFRRHHPGKTITLINLGVSSETVSGLSEPEHPFPRPCALGRADRALAEAKPDWTVICYGMNDAIYHPGDPQRTAAYQNGIRTLAEKARGAGSKVILVTPPPFDALSVEAERLLPEGAPEYSFQTPFKDYSKVLEGYGHWILEQDGILADAVADIYQPLARWSAACHEADPEFRYGDGIHPAAEGHWIIARTLLSALFNVCLERQPRYVEEPESSALFTRVLAAQRLMAAAWRSHVGHDNPNVEAGLPLEEAQALVEAMSSEMNMLAGTERLTWYLTQSRWQGVTRYDGYFEGREFIVLAPETPCEGNPWIWRTEFMFDFDQADRALLEKGWHRVYLRISNQYGCPGAVATMARFHRFVCNELLLDTRPVLFGFSRGGLYASRYVQTFPERVRGVYLDAPVQDVTSWPAGKGKGCGAPAQWEECMAVLGLEADRLPVWQPEALKVPVLLISGDADVPVPWEENGARLSAAMEAGNKPVTCFIKPGGGHHPHSLPDPEPVVAWVEGLK